MITVSVGDDFKQAMRFMEGAQKQIKYAAAVALTRVAKQAESEVRVEMTKVFDRPTRYALEATRVIPATPARLTSQVWLKDRTGAPQGKDSNFLYPEVFGTPRGRKAFETALMRVGWLRSNEFLVPATGLPLDAFGNVPSGVIRSILSQAKAAGGRGLGYSSNKSDSARSKATVRKRGSYFVADQADGLPRGIFQRINFATGSKRVKYTTAKDKQRTKTQLTYGANAIRMVFKIVVGKPNYRPRLRLFDIGQRVAARDFRREFDLAYQQALATAR